MPYTTFDNNSPIDPRLLEPWISTEPHASARLLILYLLSILDYFIMLRELQVLTFVQALFKL